MAALVADGLGCPAEQVLVASTGVIGEPLEAEKFAHLLGGLAAPYYYGGPYYGGPYYGYGCATRMHVVRLLAPQLECETHTKDIDFSPKGIYFNGSDFLIAGDGNNTVEILTADFLRKDGAIETVVAARPDVFNHNLETVPRLYPTIRPGARYFTSLRLLSRVKEVDPAMFTKSGLMVGLGETREEILQVMDDLRAADVDFLTVGQYLQPTPKHAPIDRFWTPAEFDELAAMARAKGFLMVSASPLTRSSYHAGEDFARLKAARAT